MPGESDIDRPDRSEPGDGPRGDLSSADRSSAHPSSADRSSADRNAAGPRPAASGARVGGPFERWRKPALRIVSVVAAALSLSYASSYLALGEPSGSPIGSLGAAERALAHSRRGLEDVLGYARAHPELFFESRQRSERRLSRAEREQVWRTWESFLDHVLALDAVGREFGDFLQLESETAKRRGFKLAFGAFLTQYRFALDFLAITENDPTLHKVLNEPAPERGIAAGTYSRVKYRFLNLLRGAEFARLSAVDQLYGEAEDAALERAIDEDQAVLWKAGRGAGPLLTAENGLQIVKDAGFTAWFPVQRGVSEWMGDTRVRRNGRSLVSAEQIEQLGAELRPGDILLERREWYLSNIGLPGFWPHAALYVGTPDERRRDFGDALEQRLRSAHAETYAQSRSIQDDGHVARVIEAISEGVSLTTLEHSADADSVVALRPRLPAAAKARAIERAFALVGRPYDFDFDFVTDAALVCTELVAKAYEPSADLPGLRFPELELLGRIATPANEIARQFDADFGTDAQQLDFVSFLDGNERRGIASRATLDEFRESWRRPKWHILLQGIAQDER